MGEVIGVILALVMLGIMFRLTHEIGRLSAEEKHHLILANYFGVVSTLLRSCSDERREPSYEEILNVAFVVFQGKDCLPARSDTGEAT